jgi:heterodisulfide reductase subunit A
VEKELMEKEPERIEGQLVKSLAGSNFGDVMVVGGGISGIQASLDLAAAGFKVYLVDKAPAIGGHMAQLDKTFPTNDCSM